VNVVSVIGTLARDPELQDNRAGIPECRMTLAVPRRSRDGRRYPGVVFLDVTAFGEEARECAERLSKGASVGLSGRLSDDPSGHVLIDQLDFL
jgi:single-strand DNA-binding protein